MCFSPVAFLTNNKSYRGKEKKNRKGMERNGKEWKGNGDKAIASIASTLGTFLHPNIFRPELVSY